MEKKFNISESELVKVVNTLVEQRLKEAMTGSNNASPASDGTVKMVTSTLDADGLFPTGSSEPNPKNSQFQNITKAIVASLNDGNIKKPITVKVQGGASAVGSPKFDNKKLADNRAKNMIDYLTQNIGRQTDANQVNFEQLPSVVGKATVKDSPEAKREQFVKISYPSSAGSMTSPTTARDNTATSKKDMSVRDLDRNKIVGTTVAVKLMRDSDGRIVPMNSNTYKDINSVLTKYGIYLTQDHLGSKKGG
jgi:hypothetical protein